MRTGIVNGVYTGVNDGIEQGAYTGVNEGLEQGLYYETINKDGIVREGLRLFYDIGFSPSYPKAGSNINDMSGNAYSGTLTNSPRFDNIIYGGLDFSGTGRPYVAAPDIGNYSTISYTLEVWVYPINPASTRWYILTKASTCEATQMTFEFGRTANRFSFVYRDDVIITSSNIYPLNRWYHGVVTRNNNGDGTYTSTLYVNSLFDATSTRNFGGSGTGNVNIGDVSVCSRVNSFIGKVGVVRIYNRTLTPEEIAQNFNATKYKFLL
jgi:hypothetical protein